MLIRTLVLLLITASVSAQSLEKARTLYESRNLAEARKLFAAVKESSDSYAEAQYYLGRIAFDESKYEDAADYFEEAVDINDKVAEYHNWYGNALGNIAKDANMMRQGFLAPKMKSAWEKAVALKADYLDPRMSLIQYYLQAPGFMGGSIDKAKETAREILKIKPVEGHRQLGNIYVYEKKNVDAEKAYLDMVKADPAYAPVLGNFYLNQKLYDKAFAMFEEALKKKPDDWLALYQLGKTSAISGQRLDRGEACLLQYLKHIPGQQEPSLAGAHMRLGQIHEKRGHKTDARKSYEAALGLDSSMKEAKEGLGRVSK